MKNVFAFNQNILVLKNFYFHPGFFLYKIFLFSQKQMRSMKFFND